MLKIAVIGSTETVIGFKALGLETWPAENAAQAKEALKQLTAEGEETAIIYIEESLSVPLQSEIDKFKDRPTPAIILIPGRDGSAGLGLSALNAAVERAVGPAGRCERAGRRQRIRRCARRVSAFDRRDPEYDRGQRLYSGL